MTSALAMACAAGWLAASGPTPSNIAPLAFGMTATDAATALGVPLTYVAGRPGSEVFVAIRRTGPPVMYPIRERVYLQFRRGCLTGFKTEWQVGRHGRF